MAQTIFLETYTLEKMHYIFVVAETGKFPKVHW